MSELTPGEPVEVEKVWAATGNGVLKDWFAGYVFVRAEGETAVLRHTRGLYVGLEVRFPLASVRKATASGKL